MVDACELIIHVVARAQGKPRPVHAARFSAAGQRALARRQRHGPHRQRPPLRAAPLRTAVLQAGLRRHGTISRWPGERARCAPRRGAPARPGRAPRHAAARNSRLAPGETITVRVRRSERRRSSQNSSVPYRKWMRVLDALNWIAENGAPDLAYRWFCGSKMCGTCAVRMNGREVLACWEAVEPDMTIEPLRNLPVIRDLVVDRAPFERQGRSARAVARARGALRGLSRAAQPQGDEERLEGARLHRLHVLLLGLPGDRARRSHRLRRPRTAGAARADRARSAQRSRPRSRARCR